MIIVFENSNTNSEYLLLIFGDMYYIDLIRNLYENVILKYKILNFIVVTASNLAYHEYKKYSIPIEFIKYNISKYRENTHVHTSYFVKKMHIRTFTLLFYIKYKQSLIHIDADTYYIKNPLNIYHIGKNSDIAFACDDEKCKLYNTGYMYKKEYYIIE